MGEPDKFSGHVDNRFCFCLTLRIGAFLTAGFYLLLDLSIYLT